MKTENTGKQSIQILLSIITMVLGFISLVFCIIVEDEPGGVSLLLIVVGTIWFFVTRFRQRSQSRTQ